MSSMIAYYIPNNIKNLNVSATTHMVQIEFIPELFFSPTFIVVTLSKYIYVIPIQNNVVVLLEDM